MADWKATGLLGVCRVEFLICNAPPTELEYIRRGIFWLVEQSIAHKAFAWALLDHPSLHILSLPE